MKKNLFGLILAMGLCDLFFACKPKPLPEPKPMGYFRIDLPNHQYRTLDTSLPFRYEQSVFANNTIEKQKDNTLWMTISYPDLKASLRFTCFEVKTRTVCAS